MRSWKIIAKRSALALVAAGVALTWSQTGRAQAPCTIERGLDPLDVLNSGVRHNVWIVLDSSGSMDETVPGSGGQTKMQVARDTLIEVINEFVDGSGRPLVNWGYVRFGRNGVNNTSACLAQFTNNCTGLNLQNLINPPACSQPSNAGLIKNALAALSPTSGDGSTPNGISLDQISNEIVSRGFVSGLLPNQKNFVILVTDGDDTCECGLPGTNASGKLVNGVWTPTAVPPFDSANTVPRSLRGGTADSSYTQNVGTNNNDGPNIRAINTGSKARLLYERLNPTAADRATGEKGGGFVIGLGLGGDSPKRAHHYAWEASGAFYGNTNAFHALLANDKIQLKKALRDAFARIGIPASKVSLGSPTVGTVAEVVPQFTNTSVSADDLLGDVGPTAANPDDVREARNQRGNHQNNVVFSTSADVPGFKGHFTAHNIYKVTDPANPRTGRQADFTPIWDAGARLQLVDPASRNIVFNKRGQTTLLPFDSSNVSAADLGVDAGYLSAIDGTGALTANDARDMVIGVTRGYRLSKDPLTGKLYRSNGEINFSTVDANGDPTWRLYEAIAAPAVVSAPPRSPDFDPPQNHADEYGVGGTQVGDGFYWDHFNRRTMVYLPTNGGMMHAFDAETGDEVFGYIPDDVMSFAPGEVLASRSTLKDFVELVVAENNGIANHQFLLSGSPTVRDAFLRSDNGGDDQWHTLLVFGRGRGGRFVTGLDVTDPMAPKLRFNVGNREGINDGSLDGLGETWSVPVMGNVQTTNPTSDPDRVDQWLAFFGGGYGCNNASAEGHHVFALRVENGSLYYSRQVSNDNTAAVPYNALVAMPALYNPHLADVVDSKDFITRVYFPDVQGNIWKLVTLDQSPTSWTLAKFAEVGKNQPISAALTLLKDVNAQHVYVMGGSGGDLRVSAASTLFKFFTYVDRDAEGANTTQYPLGSAPLWSKELLQDERTYVTPVTIGEIGDPAPPLVFFAASAPTFDTTSCTGKFFSSLYALGILSGQPEVDLDGSGTDERVDLGESKVSGVYARDGNLYVAESGGLGGTSSLSMYGDGDFSDDIATGGIMGAIQMLVDGFRISPF